MFIYSLGVVLTSQSASRRPPTSVPVAAPNTPEPIKPSSDVIQPPSTTTAALPLTKPKPKMSGSPQQPLSPSTKSAKKKDTESVNKTKSRSKSGNAHSDKAADVTSLHTGISMIDTVSTAQQPTIVGLDENK